MRTNKFKIKNLNGQLVFFPSLKILGKLKLILIAFSVLFLQSSFLLNAQDGDCQRMLKEARKALKNENFEVANNKLNAAKICQEARKRKENNSKKKQEIEIKISEIDKEIFNLFRKINELRKKAKSEKERADNEKERADSLRNEAIAALKLAKKNAKEARKNAKEARKNAEEAKRNAEEARKNAKIARKNEEKAIIAEQKALNELNEKKELVNAGIILSEAVNIQAEDHTLAAQITKEAAKHSRNKSIASIIIKRNILSNPRNQFYKTTFRKHRAAILAIAYSPNGKYFATAGSDGLVRLWDLNEKLINTFRGHKGAVRAVAFSPDGQFILTSSGNKVAILWGKKGNIKEKFEDNKPITSVAFTSDGKVLTGGNGHKVTLWKLDGNKEPALFDGFDDNISAITCSPNGKYLLASSQNGIAKLWNLQEEQKNRRIVKDGIKYKSFPVQHGEQISSVAFSPNSEYFITAGSDQSITLWNLKGKAIKIFRGHIDEITSVIFSPNGHFILSASRDKTAKLWNLKGDVLKTFRGHFNEITSIAFSPDGKYILTGSKDETVKQWSLEGLCYDLVDKHNDYISTVTFSPDGQQILTGSGDNTIKIWNTKGNEIVTLEGHQGYISSMIFSPNGQQILTIGKEGNAILWDNEGNKIRIIYIEKGIANFSKDGKNIVVKDGKYGVKVWNLQGERINVKDFNKKELNKLFRTQKRFYILNKSKNKISRYSLNRKKLKKVVVHEEEIFDYIVSENERYILSIVEGDSAILWNSRGKIVNTFKGQKSKIKTIAISSDNKMLALGEEDGLVSIHQINPSLSNSKIINLRGHSEAIYCMSFSPQNNSLLTGSEDKTAKLWDLQGKEIQHFGGPNHSVSSVSFDSKGKSLLISTGRTAVRRTINGKKMQQLVGYYGKINATAFSPKEELMLTGSGKIAILWNYQGDTLQILRGHTEIINAVTFSPNGQMILTASDDRSVILWDKNGTKIKSFTGHRSKINAIAFSPNGSTFLTGGKDNQTKLWDLNGNLLASVGGHANHVQSLAFSPKGKCFITGSRDGKAFIWSVSGRKLQKLEGHEKSVNAVDFTSDGKYVLSASTDKTMKIWAVTNEDASFVEQSHSLMSYDLPAPATAAVFHPNQGEYILVGYENNNYDLYQNRIHQLENDQQIAALTIPQKIEYKIPFEISICSQSEYLNDMLECADYFENKYLKKKDPTIVSGLSYLYHKAFSDSTNYTIEDLKETIDNLKHKRVKNNKRKKLHFFYEQQENKLLSILRKPVNIRQLSITDKLKYNILIELAEIIPSTKPKELIELLGSLRLKIEREIYVDKINRYEKEVSEIIKIIEHPKNNHQLSYQLKVDYNLPLDSNHIEHLTSIAEITKCAFNYYGKLINKNPNVFSTHQSSIALLFSKAEKLCNQNEKPFYSLINLRDTIQIQVIQTSSLQLKTAYQNYANQLDKQIWFGIKDYDISTKDLRNVVKKYTNLISYSKKPALKVQFQQSIVKIEEFLLEKNEKNKSAKKLANAYANLAKYQLYNKQAPQALYSAQKGLAIDNTQTWIFTQIAPAYLYSWNYLEARKIYKDWMNKPWATGQGEGDFQTFGEAFLYDLEQLEKKGITNPNAVNVKTLLNIENGD